MNNVIKTNISTVAHSDFFYLLFVSRNYKYLVKLYGAPVSLYDVSVLSDGWLMLESWDDKDENKGKDEDDNKDEHEEYSDAHDEHFKNDNEGGVDEK